MSTHRFTVTIPNQTARSARTELRLEPVKPAQLRNLGLPLPEERLPLEHAGIARDPCEDGESRLKLRLKAYESVEVCVTAVTGPPADPAAGGAVALNLVDRRRGQTGGVLLVAVDSPLVEPPGSAVPAPNPCPVTLDGDVYFVDPERDPTAPVRQTLPAGRTFDLVAPLVNRSRVRVTNVTAYLEHLGPCDAAFIPALWNLGSLRRDPFYAVWTVAATGSLVGTVRAVNCRPGRQNGSDTHSRADPHRGAAPRLVVLPIPTVPGADDGETYARLRDLWERFMLPRLP